MRHQYLILAQPALVVADRDLFGLASTLLVSAHLVSNAPDSVHISKVLSSSEVLWAAFSRVYVHDKVRDHAKGVICRVLAFSMTSVCLTKPQKKSKFSRDRESMMLRRIEGIPSGCRWRQSQK